MSAYKQKKSQRGMVLLTCILMLSVVTLVASSLISLSVAELKSSAYSSRAHRAFYEAEAGARYVINCINRDLSSGSINFSSPTPALNVDYTAPNGYSFDPVSSIDRLGNNAWYMFSVTGHCGNTKSSIEVTVRRPSVFGGVGVFGGTSIRFQPMVDIYSYRSSELLNPTPADSTGEANIGSNGGITVQNNVTVDGIFFMGADELGYHNIGPVGYECEYVDHIDPDPLGAVNGPLAAAIAYSVSNNVNAAAGIVGNEINLGAHGTLTVGSGVYYLTLLELGAHSVLTVNSSIEDPTIIYLQGDLRIQPQSAITTTSGSPRSLYIFGDNNCTSIRFQPQNDFMGFIYTPYADIRVQPQCDVYGILWANTIRLQPQGDIYIDVSLMDSFHAAYVELVQWRRL